VIRAMLVATAAGFLALVVLWAFASYLDPAFSGEVASGLLVCN
jgi:hypothetical protein